MAKDAWSNPDWGVAAKEYRRAQPKSAAGTGRTMWETFRLADARLADDRKAGRRVEGAETLRARRLLAEDVSFERAYSEINDPRSRPTPDVTIDTVVYAVQARGLAVLREPAILHILHACDARAEAEIDRRIDELIAQKRIAA
jgi:hypothetical protein